MKKLLLTIALAAVTMMAGAQTSGITLTEDGAYERKDVVTVDSVSAAVLYDRAMLALTDWTGPDGKAQAGIDYQNQETHTVVYKGRFYAGARKMVMSRVDRYANFTVKVRCKDGRAQVTVSIPTMTAVLEPSGRTQTISLGEAVEQLGETAGKRRERGEETMAYVTNTADVLFTAMADALQGTGKAGGDADDDF